MPKSKSTSPNGSTECSDTFDGKSSSLSPQCAPGIVGPKEEFKTPTLQELRRTFSEVSLDVVPGAVAEYMLEHVGLHQNYPS